MGCSFPSRLRNQKQVVFQPLTISTTMRTLHNPRYAGAYAYGRRLYRRTVDGKKQLRKREPNDWLACIPDAHPGYISWERFQANLKLLEANGVNYETARASPPREGSRHCCRGVPCVASCRRAYEGPITPLDAARWTLWYVCNRAYSSRGEPHCQTIARSWPVDEVIGDLIAAEMTPHAVELALEIRKEIEARYDEADRLRRRAVERAQIDAELAQRRVHAG